MEEQESYSYRRGCDIITNNYTILKNNSRNEYGTSVLVKNDIQIENFRFDTEGRVIVFNIDDMIIVNTYPKAGTDADSRKDREELFTSTLPNVLLYPKQHIIMGGDWNCIINDLDCTNFPD